MCVRVAVRWYCSSLKDGTNESETCWNLWGRREEELKEGNRREKLWWRQTLSQQVWALVWWPLIDLLSDHVISFYYRVLLQLLLWTPFSGLHSFPSILSGVRRWCDRLMRLTWWPLLWPLGQILILSHFVVAVLRIRSLSLSFLELNLNSADVKLSSTSAPLQIWVNWNCSKVKHTVWLLELNKLQ